MSAKHVQAALNPPEGLAPEEWPAYLAWLAGHAEEAGEAGEGLAEAPPAEKKPASKGPRKGSPPAPAG